MTAIHKLLLSTFAAVALVAVALPAQAAYIRVHAAPDSMTAIDGGASSQDKNLSTATTSKVLVNYDENGEVDAVKGKTAVLLQLPDALLRADPGSLARATLTFDVFKANNWQPDIFTPRLFPLATNYAFSEVTWNSSAANTPWATPGGDTLEAYVDGSYDNATKTLSFDLLPLLTDADARAALDANGALIRLAYDELPESAGFSMLNLNNTQATNAALLPDAYFVLGTPDATPSDVLLAMTAIDGGASSQDKNLSTATTSKVLVNYDENGDVDAVKGKTAVLLRLPEALLSADAANLSRATLVFDVFKANNWQPDIFTPRLFPLATPYAFSEVTWNSSAAGTPWTTAGGDTLDTYVDGAYDNNSKTLSFDILPLLTDATASAALADNGALIRLAYDALPEVAGFSMLNLHNTQADADLLPTASWRLASAEVGESDESDDVATVYYIDASEPTANEFTDSVRFIINANETKGDTRVLMTLPDLDLPTVASLGTLHFKASLNWRNNPSDIPACANVLTTPFGTTEATAATWNLADHSDATTAWEGGAFSDALSFPAVFGESSVDFDLSALLTSDLRDTAFDNGLILRWTGEARDSITNSHVKHTLYRENPAPALAWEQRPVSYSYIDKGKPAVNFGWSGATRGKCIVLLNKGEGEARTLVKFAPSFFEFDPAQQSALLLSFPYGREFVDDEVVSTIALYPLTTPFRMDQATWNNAADGTPWTTAGGDYDSNVSVAGSIDRDAQVITFDMTPLFYDTAALANLRDNGALLRITSERPESASSSGFNFMNTDGPVAEAILTDGVEFRSATATPDASGIAFDVTGLNPTADYAVYSCTNLVEGVWTWVRDVPDNGQATVAMPEGTAFFRIQLRE